jgi:hypothetical protein
MINVNGGSFISFSFMYVIQRRFTCRPSDSSVSEDAGIKPMRLLRFRHWQSVALTTWLDIIYIEKFCFFNQVLRPILELRNLSNFLGGCGRDLLLVCFSSQRCGFTGPPPPPTPTDDMQLFLPDEWII